MLSQPSATVAMDPASGTAGHAPLSYGQKVRHLRTLGGRNIDADDAPPALATAWLHPVKYPLLGGLYLTDILVAITSLGAHLLRACPLAELLDMIWFGIVFLGTPSG